MTVGLVGQKRGMTRVFTETGEAVPVSVVEVEPNVITQIKTLASDGYSAIQVTTGKKHTARVIKPEAGHFAKAGVEAGLLLREFRVEETELEGDDAFAVGQALTVTRFDGIKQVDVTGTSKGKGFAGVIKRHNFSGQDNTHGNSLSHRAPGSIGQCQTPGRVFKGKKMAGQMGNVRKTVQNLALVSIDEARNLLLIRGGIPGAPGGRVVVTPAVKVQHTGGNN